MSASHDINPDARNAALDADTILQNRYLIVRQLGRGGMGAVYEAVDQRLGITVALKETLSSEPSMRKQFEHEARLLAGMQHPALPRVSDHFVEGNRAFLVMQFIGGVDLARIIAQQPGPFPRDQVVAWADQLLDALVYLHSRDREVIHRDIKPHNLKLTSTGQIALLDFGLAKAQPSDPSVTSSQAFFGYTRHYAPLEQIQDQRTDPRSDIYALGATLYHLLTGIKPPDAMVRASALISAQPDPLKPADQIHAAVGPQISAILQKAMAQTPEERYATAQEFREAFRRMGRTTAALETAQDAVTNDDETASPASQLIQQFNPAAGTVVQGGVPIKMVMVESARRFGPGTMTAVLVVLVVLAGGALYGSQSLFGSEGQPTAARPLSTSVAERQLQTARRTERARVSEPVRTAELNTSTTKKPKPTENDKDDERRVSRREPANADASKHTRRAVPQEEKRTSSRSRVSPPNIRLPNPEFSDYAPARSTASPRAYRVSSVRPVAGPKFYRAADGTQIVTFSDGSTQFVRTAQTGVRPAGSYR